MKGGGTKLHVLRGFIKAFLVYLVPITVLKRKLGLAQIRRAFALGVFVSGVRVVDSVLKLTHSPEGEGESAAKEITFLRKYSLGIAAGLSSFVAITIDGELPQSILVLMWAVARAFRACIPDSLNFPGASTLVMCLSASRLLTAYVWTPGELTPSYYKFLVLHGGKSEKNVLDILKHGGPNGCGTIHPGQRCSQHFVNFWLEEYIRACKIYVPVFTLSLILSHKRNLVHWGTNILRSSAFLATYCSFAWWFSMCIYNGYIMKGNMTKIHYYFSLWFAGLSTLIEREPRRVELATYCFTYAGDSLLRGLEKKGFPILFPTLNLFILSICTGLMVHNHDQQPKEIMRFLFKLSSV